jgi:small basic protein (TIGR04137 family)
VSIDRSLKSKNVLARHRNVLTRAERLVVLEDEDRWDESQSVFGLPKVVHRKSSAGQKSKKEEKQAEEVAAAEGGEPTAAAEGGEAGAET